ncbi:MAG: Ig-like domain-containing protein, partial [Mariprofundaceae bacterium]
MGWPGGQASFSIQEFSNPGGVFDSACQQAINTWNNKANFTLTGINAAVDPCSSTGGPDSSHGWTFSANDCGLVFGAGVLAVTTSWTSTAFLNGASTTTRVDSDIVFNSSVSWDVHSGADTGINRDFRRVAAHELGHAVGIDHDNGSIALMNTHYGSIEAPQSDDIAALIALYGSIGGGGGRDSMAPQVTSVSWVDATHLIITFDEPVNGATLAGNYSINGILIMAVVSLGGNQYQMSTSSISAGATFMVVVRNVTDIAGNMIDPNANSGSFTRPANRAPVFTNSPTINPSVAKVGTRLNLQGDISDADSDPITVTYQWMRDGVDIVQATQEAYVLNQPDAHSDISCLLSADDGQGGSANSTTASIFVQNSPPVATDDTITLLGLASVTVSPLDNDSDADGDTLTISAVDAVSIGGATIVDEGGGRLTYIPSATFTDTDSFTYSIDDNHVGTAIGKVMVILPAVGGLTEGQKELLGLALDLADSDGDGLSDVVEVGDPNDAADSDSDGVIDALEPGDTAENQSIAAGLPLMGGGTLSLTSDAQVLTQVLVTPLSSGAHTDADANFGEISFKSTVTELGGSQILRITTSTQLPSPLALFKVD